MTIWKKDMLGQFLRGINPFASPIIREVIMRSIIAARIRAVHWAKASLMNVDT
jgi:hypothetical protein